MYDFRAERERKTGRRNTDEQFLQQTRSKSDVPILRSNQATWQNIDLKIMG